MRISVCMGTYNGSLYIKEQLDSILCQTRAADEVIICDDKSEDNTRDILEDYIRKHHLQRTWKLIEGEDHRGYPYNFYNAMKLCRGDIVFLADQDDIWHRRKLERMSSVLEAHPECMALCCKFGLIDGRGDSIRSLMAPVHSGNTGRLRSVDICDVFRKCEWPGMVIAYRNDWYSERSTAGLTVPHDFLICAWSAEQAGFFQLDEELAWHRRHDRNTGGEEHRLRKLLDKEQKLKEIDRYLRYLEDFDGSQILRTEKGRRALREKTVSMRERREALLSGKWRRILGAAARNRRQVRLATLLCDLWIAKQRDKRFT